MNDSKPLDHLTADQLATILEYIEEVDAILVGGQSLAVWARWFLARYPQIARVYSISSEDVDFYANAAAAKKFAERLGSARIFIAPPFENSPNAAVVEGELGDRKVRIDFMRNILGVDPKSIKKNFVTLSRPARDGGKPINILILHPLDCLRSRLSNVNDLHREDPHSVSSARAAVLVVEAFIDDHLRRGDFRQAQAMLMNLYYIARDRSLGKMSHLKFGIDPGDILLKFRLDLRLAQTWRTNQLASAIERLKTKASKLARSNRS
ncbi:hypothetical protein ACVWZV_003425 [Bradyrhizobium sp. GM5.1]